MKNKNSISLAVIAVAVLSIALVQSASARTTDAHSRGQIDATRDYHGLNGHGYDDSCPSGHSSSFCSNYKDGYTTQWTVTANNDMLSGGNGNGYDGNSAQTGAIGGNQIKAGDNSQVNVNQFLNQRDNSPQASSNGENADHNGGLSNCKAFCVN